MPSHSSGRILFAACAALVLLILAGCVVAAASGAVWPTASGDVVYKKSGAVVDASNAVDGYFMTKYSASKKRLVASVAKGDMKYQYDQNGKGDYEVYALQMGTGKYKVNMYEQVKGSKFAQKAALSFSVKDMDGNAPFLCPNQYVWYTEDTEVVKIAEDVCAGLETALEKVNAVHKHIKAQMTYDYVLASTVKSGYLPDIDAAYNKKMGICFDLSAIVACMLRTQGVPVKLVIGYADKNYHAWNEVYVDGEYKKIDLTGDITGGKASKYTPERYY